MPGRMVGGGGGRDPYIIFLLSHGTLFLIFIFHKENAAVYILHPYTCLLV